MPKRIFLQHPLRLGGAAQIQVNRPSFIRMYGPAVLFLLVGLLGYGLRAVDYFAAVPGDLGDARLNSVILEHLFRWVTGKENSLWSPAFFYPFEGVLAFSDNHFGSAASYILLRLFGLNREIAFDGWFLIGNCLNFFAAYIAIRRLGLSGFGAAVGAFVFAFSLAVLPKEGHAQLTYRFAIPLAYIALLELVATKRLYILWRVIFWTTVQFYCSIYLGVFLVFLLTATLVAARLLDRGVEFFRGFIHSFRNEKTSALTFAGTTSVLAVTALIWLFYRYHAIDADYRPGSWRFDQIPQMLPRISSYLLADQSSLYERSGRWIHDIPMRHEHQMFFGAGIWILGIFGAVTAWRGHMHQALGKVAILAFFILFAVTLSVQGHSLYSLIAPLPGVSQIRAVARIVLVMLLPVSILVAIGSEQLLRKFGNTIGIKEIAVALSIIFILSIEIVSYQPRNAPVSLWIERQATLREKLPKQLPDNPILFVSQDDSEPFYLAELDAMILVQEKGIPTLNGYSGSFPPGYMEPKPCYSYVNRLNGYAAHRHLARTAMQSISDRVVVVAYSRCEQTPVVASSGPISAEQVKKIAVSLRDLQVTHQSLTASVVVTNGSNTALNTVSSTGTPVRLSWRFVSVSPSGGRLQELSFDARKNLEWSISPNASSQTEIYAELPRNPGNYLFEVSLVQDGVVWFHDLGMAIASVPITVGGERNLSPVTAAQAKQIRLAISDVELTSETLTANIVITNGSGAIFNSSPVRFSWRFVSISSSGGRLQEPGFDTRKDLEWPIAPGISKQTKISAKLPRSKGNYLFEVSLVQDGVAWFHDLGMVTAKFPIVVENAGLSRSTK